MIIFQVKTLEELGSQIEISFNHFYQINSFNYYFFLVFYFFFMNIVQWI